MGAGADGFCVAGVHAPGRVVAMTRATVLLIAIGVLSAGCQGAVSDRPPTVRYGEDACVQCRMLINEARFAAAAVSPSGELRTFDDLGCLLTYLHEHPDIALGRLWIHDYESEAWLGVSTASFVSDVDLATPMGYGVVALATPEQAARLAEAIGGRVIARGQLPLLEDILRLGARSVFHDHDTTTEASHAM